MEWLFWTIILRTSEYGLATLSVNKRKEFLAFIKLLLIIFHWQIPPNWAKCQNIVAKMTLNSPRTSPLMTEERQEVLRPWRRSQWGCNSNKASLITKWQYCGEISNLRNTNSGVLLLLSWAPVIAINWDGPDSRPAREREITQTRLGPLKISQG